MKRWPVAGLTAPLIGLAFVCAVCSALLRSVPDVLDRSLTSVRQEGAPRLFPLPILSSQQGLVTRQVGFLVADRAALSKVDELRMAIHRYGLDSRITLARLEVRGTDCIFTATGRMLESSSLLSLSRTAQCSTDPGPGHATLTVQLAAPSASAARVAIWISAPTTGGPPLLTIDGENGETPVGRSIQYRSPARVRTASLLAWMWNQSEGELWVRLAIAGVLLLAGATLSAVDSRAGVAALSAFYMATSLALYYTIVVPPLQAPDEPDHLLSFAALTNRADTPVLTATWARRVHFDRIAFTTEEHFTPANRDAMDRRPWSNREVFAEDVARRSSSATRWWKLVSVILPSDPAGILIGIRTANAVLFGLAFGVATAVLVAGGATTPTALALILLSIPTLPFFAMQMSEITPNIVAFVLIAYTAAGLLMNPDNDWLGLLLGLSTALVASGSRSGWPLAATIACLLGARVLARSGERRPAWFWVAFVAPVLLLFGSRFLEVPVPIYDQWYLGLESLRSVTPTAVMATTATAAATGYALEWGWSILKRRTGASLRVFRFLALAGAVWIAGMLVASVFVQLPLMPHVGAARAGLLQYLRPFIYSVLTTPRVSGSDFLLWTSFVGGFGWIDALLPQGVVTGLTVLGSAAAIWLLIAVSRDPADHRSATACLTAAGILGSLVGGAIGAYGMNRNIHGRYLLGPYLVAIGILGAAPMLPAAPRLSAVARTAILLTISLGVHAISIWVIVERYFG